MDEWPREVQDTIVGMGLPEKAAQVLLVAFDGTEVTEPVRAAFIAATPGGVLLLGRNVAGMDQLRTLTSTLQEVARSAGAPALFVAADEEGGPVMRVKEGVPRLPAAREVAARSTPAQAKALAEETAAGLLGQGVNMVLAPVADVVSDEGSFLFKRSYGGDPRTVSAFAAAITSGFTGRGLLTVVKHFPGHGSAPEDSHDAAPVSAAGLEEFESVHLPPFRAAVEAGAGGVMAGHFIAPAYDRLRPSSQSPAVLGRLLRNDLGFRGLVVCDDLEMSAATGRAGEVGTAGLLELGRAAVAALSAGCDLLITTGTLARQSAVRQAIVDAVTSGELSAERLDEAVARILDAKLAYGLPLAPGSGAGL